jgi:uncharacterized repeat protein (TIGR01451 family)
MKSKVNHGWGSLAKVGLVIVLFFGVAQAAQANLAADHTVRNEATVTYDDAANTGNAAYTDTDAVDITVRLVRAVATVTPDATINDALDSPNLLALGSLTSLLYYDITNNSNGIDTVTATSTKTSGAADATLTLSGGGSYSLAGTTLATTTTLFLPFATGTNTGTLTIVVPTDATDDGTVNGFLETQGAAKQKLRFSSGGVCDVDSAVESETANGTSTITISNCDVVADTNPAAGVQIGEVLRVSVTVTPTVGGTMFVDTVFTTNNIGTPVLLTFTEELLIAAPNLTIVKYVRNTDAAGQGGNTCTSNRDCLTVGGTAYFSSLITADPTDTLEYAVLIVNDGNTQAIEVSVTDIIDSTASFVSFAENISVVTRALGDNCGAAVPTCVVLPTYTDSGDVQASTQTAAATAAAFASASFVDPTLTVGAGYDLTSFVAGNVAAGDQAELVINPAAAPTGGAIEAGEVSVVIFQVLVD